jgi:hypothetical protein
MNSPSGHTLRTALRPKPALGWALITHPFHPLCGQRFAVLKVRKIGGQEVLSLYDENKGSLSIPRDWTDQAELPSYADLMEPAPILEVRCLLKLHGLLRALTQSIDDERKCDNIRPVI